MPVLAQSTSDLKQRELKDKAHQLVRKGKLEAALAIYHQLAYDNPKDAGLRLHQAELCVKLERPSAAVSSYLAAAQLFSQAGYQARAKAAVGCGLRIAPNDPGLLKELRALNREPSNARTDPPAKVAAEAKTDPPKKTTAAKLQLVPWTQPLEADEVRAREVTQKKPEPRTHTSSLRLVPVAENLFDEESVTEPYFPLPDWLDDEAPSAPRPPLRPAVDQHFPQRVTVSERSPRKLGGSKR